MEVLDVNICSVRNLEFKAKKMNPFIQCTVGKYREKTCVKKNCGAFPMWNQKFVFKVKSRTEDFLFIELKQRERFQQNVIGVARVELPSAVNQLCDKWVPLVDEMYHEPIGSDIHIVLQLETISAKAKTSLFGIPSPSLRSSPSNKQLRTVPPPPPRPPHPTSGLPPALYDNAMVVPSEPAPLPGGGVGRDHEESNGPDEAHHSPTRSSSFGFDGHATASLLNDILTSLEEVKDVVDAVQAQIDSERNPTGDTSPTSATARANTLHRIARLKQARKLLVSIEAQIRASEPLSDEWKDKILIVVGEYLAKLDSLFESQTWTSVSMRLSEPPVDSSADPYALDERLRRLSRDQSATRQGSVSGGDAVAPPTTSSGCPASGNDGRSITIPKTEVGPAIPLSMNDETPIGTDGPLTVSRGKARKHVLGSLEAFDDLVDNGLAVRIISSEPEHLNRIIDVGDSVSLRYSAYIWDPTNSVAIEFANSDESGLLTFVVGNEDVTPGLDVAVQKLSQGTHFVATLAPEMGFGDEGSDEGVPPNTHIVYDAKIVDLSQPHARKHQRKHSNVPPDFTMMYAAAELDEGSHTSPQKSYDQCPGRHNRVSQRLVVSQHFDDDLAESSGISASQLEQLRDVLDADDAARNVPPPPRSPSARSRSNSHASMPMIQEEDARSVVCDEEGEFGLAPPPPPTPSDDDEPTPDSAATMLPPPRLPFRPPALVTHQADSPNPKKANTKKRNKKSGPPPAVPPRRTGPGNSLFADNPKPSKLKNIDTQQNDVATQLENMGLGQYAPRFKDLGVDAMEDFSMIEPGDLEAIEMKPIHQRKLVAKLREAGIDMSNL